MHLGDFDTSDLVDLKFTTVGTTGAPTALSSGAISIYKDNSTTQSTTGVTLTADFDGVTGLNHVRIDTSADGTFYAAGSDFQVIITTGTVGGTSVVGYVVGSFSIRNRAHLYPTTAGRTLDVSTGGEAGVDWANVGSATTTVNLSGTTVKTATDVETKIGTPSNLGGGATLAANLSDIEAQTDDIGAAGAGLTAIPWNASWDAEVQSEVNDALVANNLDHLVLSAVDTDFDTTVHANSVIGYLAHDGAGYDRSTDSQEAIRNRGDAAWVTATGFSTHTAADIWAVGTRLLTAGTNIVLAKGTGVTGFNDLSAAQVNTEIDTALVDIRLDELLAADSDIDGAAPPAVGSVFHELMSKTAGSFTFDQTTDSLEAVRDRGDAAWVTATGFSTHTAADVWAVGTRLLTAGTNIVLAKGTGVTGFNDLSAAQVNAEADTALVDVGLTTTITGRVDAAISTRATPAQVNTEVDTALADIRLDELLAADSDIDGAAPPTVGSVFHELMSKTVGSFTFDQTTDSLEAVRDRGDAAWVTATGFSTHSASDVWAVATRVLTAGTNIVLAKGVGVTGFNDLSAAQVNTEVDTALADVGLTTTITGRIDVAVSTRASQTSVDTVDDFLDTEIADIQSRLPAALVSGRMDASVGAVVSGVITAASIADGAIDRATFAADTGLQTVRSGTAQAGGASTITLDASASATNDIYNDQLIYLTGGTGAGQTAWITDYVGATKVATVKPAWVTQPDNTTTFAVLPGASPWHQILADHLVSGSTGAALNAAGSAGDPWNTALPGSYGAGTAGFLLGTNLDAMVSSRLAPTVAGRTLDVTAAGEAGIDWANIGSPTTTVNLSGTTVKTATDVETKMGTPSNLGGGATLAANLSDIEAQTDDIGAAGAGLTAIPWNSVWDVEVQSEVNDALVANNLDHLVLSAVDTDFDTTVHEDSVIGHLASDGIGTGGGFDRVTDSLEALASAGGGGPTAGQIADAVWDEVRADHTTAGSFGQGVASVQGNVTGSTASVTGNVGGNVVGSVGSLATQAKADVNAEVDTALADIRLDELLAADSDIDGAAPPTVGSVFHELMSKTAGSFTFDQTTDSLEALRDRGDAAWITATGFSTHTAADVWAVGTRVLTAGTNIVLVKGTGITGFNDLSAAQVNSEVDTALADINLDHLVKSAVDTDFETTVHDDSVIGQLADDGTATFDRATDSLQALADSGGGGPTAGQIADAVWDEARADHTTSGTFGQGVASVQGNVTGSAASVSGAVGSVTGAVGSVTGAVGSVTGNVGGNVVGSVGSLATQAKADVNTEVDTALADINLDHLVKNAVDTDFDTTVHEDSVVGHLASDGIGTGGFYDRTTDSLEALRDRGDAAWVTATGFSTHSAADVWAVGTRVLTAGTNIVLAKGTGVTGFNDVSTVEIRSEVDTALADVGLTTDVTDRLDVAISTRADQIDMNTANAVLTTLAGFVFAETTALIKLMRADRIIDVNVTPWALVLIESGTGVIGVGTELLRKRLKDLTGGDLVTATELVGQAIQ